MQVAGDEMTVNFPSYGRCLAAYIRSIRAARVKVTAAGWRQWAWDFALDIAVVPLALKARIGYRHGGEQGPGIGVFRVPVDAHAVSKLDDLTQIHHRYA